MALTKTEACQYIRDLCVEMAKLSEKLELPVIARLFRMTDLEAQTLLMRLEAEAPRPVKRRTKPALAKKPKKLAA